MGFLALDRKLTRQERDMVRWLLEHGDPGADGLVPQIDRLTVIGKCECGCPTVDFALDGEAVPRKGEKIVSDFRAEVDGQDVGVMLFQTDGKISSLEVYSFAGSDKPFDLPLIETLHSY